MSVAEIVKEAPNLSLDEMKEVARALREAVEDSEDLEDALAVPPQPWQARSDGRDQEKYDF
jgi:hypothetical protein